MRAEIDLEGALCICAQCETEAYALNAWVKINNIGKIHTKREDGEVAVKLVIINPSVDTKLEGNTPDKTEVVKSEDVKEDDNLDREAIKKELNALGVEYNVRLKTENLILLLEKAKDAQKEPKKAIDEPSKKEEVEVLVPTPIAKALAPEKTEEADFIKEEMVVEAKKEEKAEAVEIVEKSVAAEALRRYAAKFGTPKAIAVLASFGATQVSGLSPEARTRMHDAVTKEL